MNIEKLTKYLKEFTLDEIEMIAECDVLPELEKLITDGKLLLGNDIYKYQDFENKVEFAVFTNTETENKNITLKNSFRNLYERLCGKFLQTQYNKDIYRNFENKYHSDFGNKKSERFAQRILNVLHPICKRRGMGERRLKNSLALFEPDFKIL